METIGKVLSLILLTVFGAAGAVIYLTDPYSPGLGIIESISTSYKSESDSEIDYSAYRERLRKGYAETEPPKDADSESQEESLWTNTYRYPPSPDARALAEENPITELSEKANYWKSRYHRALRSGKREEADEAYKRYRVYKEAIKIKEASD